MGVISAGAARGPVLLAKSKLQDYVKHHTSRKSLVVSTMLGFGMFYLNYMQHMSTQNVIHIEVKSSVSRRVGGSEVSLLPCYLVAVALHTFDYNQAEAADTSWQCLHRGVVHAYVRASCFNHIKEHQRSALQVSWLP